jgi:hypothetical protein
MLGAVPLLALQTYPFHPESFLVPMMQSMSFVFMISFQAYKLTEKRCKVR